MNHCNHFPSCFHIFPMHFHVPLRCSPFSNYILFPALMPFSTMLFVSVSCIHSHIYFPMWQQKRVGVFTRIIPAKPEQWRRCNYFYFIVYVLVLKKSITHCMCVCVYAQKYVCKLTCMHRDMHSQEARVNRDNKLISFGSGSENDINHKRWEHLDNNN